MNTESRRGKAVTFSGGGFTGPALLGVLRFFEDALIIIGRLLGISIGSVVAAMHMNGMTQEQMRDALIELSRPTLAELAIGMADGFRGPLSALHMDRKELARTTLSNCGLLSGVRRFKKLVQKHNLSWQDGLVIGAFDVLTKKFVEIDSDFGIELHVAIAASCAIPGVFRPVPCTDRHGRRYLFVDGGVAGTPRTGPATQPAIVVDLLNMSQYGLGSDRQEGDWIISVHASLTGVFKPLSIPCVVKLEERGYNAAIKSWSHQLVAPKVGVRSETL